MEPSGQVNSGSTLKCFFIYVHVVVQIFHVLTHSSMHHHPKQRNFVIVINVMKVKMRWRFPARKCVLYSTNYFALRWYTARPCSPKRKMRLIWCLSKAKCFESLQVPTSHEITQEWLSHAYLENPSELQHYSQCSKIMRAESFTIRKAADTYWKTLACIYLPQDSNQHFTYTRCYQSKTELEL